MDKPRYEHDCNACVYLGKHKEFDLYFCDTAFPTIIARFSSDGPDYASGMDFRDHISPLGEAFKRACEKGFLKKENYLKMIRCEKCGIIRNIWELDCAMCKINQQYKRARK
jgi:hypothetical protein